MTRESGAQTNPEPEQGRNGEILATSQPVLPLPVKLEGGQADSQPVEEAIGAPLSNGVNGLHHPGDENHNGEHHNGDAVETLGDGAGEVAAAGELTVGASPLDAGSADDIPALTALRSAVKIKGRPGGVSLELGEGEWSELILLLKDRLTTAEGFFRGGRVLLDVGPRPLVEEQLREVRTLLESHEMQLAVVRSTAERTLQAAAETGISTTNEETQESLQVAEPPLIAPDGPPNAYTSSPYAPPPEAVAARPNHFVYRGNLRSGQVLRKTESIVIIGDVNPGAQVISGGDIMVWGRLRGNAHAGAEGNRRSVVAAIDFIPTQLRIANLTAIAPEQKKARSGGLRFWKKEPERRPEIARVTDGHIVVEPWDEGKPNGLGVWRNK